MRSQCLLLLFALAFSTAAAQADQSPTEAYMELHAKELNAKSYEDLLPLRAKDSIAEDKPTSAEEKKMIFPLMHEMIPKVVKVTKETLEGSKATLLVTVPTQPPNQMGMVETTTGTITLEKEDGKWKLFKEKWDSKSESVPGAPSK